MTERQTPVPQSSGSVELKTAAYLQELEQQPDVALAAATSPSLWTVLWQTARVCTGLAVGIAVVVVAVNAMNVYAKEKDRRTCGVDWLLWASGSNKTFGSILDDRLEEARRDIDRQISDSRFAVQPFELKNFERQSLNWSPPPIRQPQSRGRK